MKKQLLKLSLVLTAVAMLGQVATAQLSENYQAPVNSVEVPEVITGSISIDGIAENTYSSANSLDYLQSGFDPADYGAPDGAASFQIAYDSENLYIFMDITDDIGHFINAADYDNPWLYDCVEIFTDANWDGDAAYHEDATQNRFDRVGLDGTPDSIAVQLHANLLALVDEADVVHAWVDDGPSAPQVQFEVAFPFAGILGGDDLSAHNDGSELGLEVSYIDSDGDPGTAGERKAILFWDEDGEGSGLGDGNAYQDVTAFGVMKLIDVVSVKQTELNSSDLSYSVNGRTITFNQDVDVYNTLGQLVGQGKIVTVENAGIYIVNGIKLAVK